MKLSEYIKDLQESLVEFGDLDVVYSTDEEGNGYHKLECGGGCMYVENLQDYFLEYLDYDELGEYEEPIKVFCIN